MLDSLVYGMTTEVGKGGLIHYFGVVFSILWFACLVVGEPSCAMG